MQVLRRKGHSALRVVEGGRLEKFDPNPGQKKRHSLLEAGISTAIGFIVAYVCNYLVLPLFGFHPTHGQIFGITVLFTVVSVIRGYYVRRLFDWLHREKKL